MKISVFGTGYVGLVTGTCFAEMGNEVICADIDEAKIKLLKQGISPIFENSLTQLIGSNQKEGRLSFTTDLDQAIHESHLLFIAVGTPSDEQGKADLSAVISVAKKIGQTLSEQKIIVNKSTVPVGTAERVQDIIAGELKRRGLSIQFDIVSNPEFLREGSAVEDCLKPARVVIGCTSDNAKDTLQRLYEPFLKSGNPLIVMDPASSELTKYAANAMLATKITLMNEFSRLCEKVGADIEQVRSGLGTDPRIGHHFIYPGLGYGGSCFPKDVQALTHTAQENSEDFLILKAVHQTNQLQRQRFFDQIKAHFSGNLQDQKIALWGLTFKPGTDDTREAPALFLLEKMAQAGARLCVYDPIAMDKIRLSLSPEISNQVTFAPTPHEALQDVDAVCIATEWKQFREPQFEKMKGLMKSPVIFDGRNLYGPSHLKQLKNLGFTYYSIGRPVQK